MQETASYPSNKTDPQSSQVTKYSLVELTKKFNQSPKETNSSFLSSNLPLMNKSIRRIAISNENIHPNINIPNPATQPLKFKIQPSNTDSISQKKSPIPGFERRLITSKKRKKSEIFEEEKFHIKTSSRNLKISNVQSFTDSMLTNSKFHSNKKLKDLMEKNKSIVEEQYRVAEITIQEVSQQMSKAIHTSDKIYKKAMGGENTSLLESSNSFNNLIEKEKYSGKNFCDSDFTVEGEKLVKSGGKILGGEGDFKHLEVLGQDLVKNMTFSDNCSYRRDCPTIQEETVEKSLNFSGGVGLTVVRNEGEVVKDDNEIYWKFSKKNFVKKKENLKEFEEVKKELSEMRKGSDKKKLLSSSLNSGEIRKEEKSFEEKPRKSEGFVEVKQANSDFEDSRVELPQNIGKLDMLDFELVVDQESPKNETFILKTKKGNNFVSFKNSEKTESKQKKKSGVFEFKDFQIESLSVNKTKKKSRKSSVKQFLNTIDDELNQVNNKINSIVNIIQRQEAVSSGKKIKRKTKIFEDDEDKVFPAQKVIDNVRKLFTGQDSDYKATFIESPRIFEVSELDQGNTLKKRNKRQFEMFKEKKSPRNRTKSRRKKSRGFSPENLRTRQRGLLKAWKKKKTLPSKSQPPKKSKKTLNFDRIEKIYKASFYINEIRTNACKVGEQRKIERELRKCTFKPKINKNDKYYGKVAKVPFEERQKQWLENRKLRKISQKKSSKINEIRGCTFKPKFKTKGSLSPRIYIGE